MSGEWTLRSRSSSPGRKKSFNVAKFLNYLSFLLFYCGSLLPCSCSGLSSRLICRPLFVHRLYNGRGLQTWNHKPKKSNHKGIVGEPRSVSGNLMGQVCFLLLIYSFIQNREKLTHVILMILNSFGSIFWRLVCTQESQSLSRR